MSFVCLFVCLFVCEHAWQRYWSSEERGKTGGRNAHLPSDEGDGHSDEFRV